MNAAGTTAIRIRDVEPGDMPLVYKTWLQGFRESDFARRIPQREYYALHHLAIERILARGATLIVAADAEDPAVVYAYLCYERVPPGTKLAGLELPPHTIHFAFTKGPLRRFGLQKQLLEHAGIDPRRCAFTHLTRARRAPMADGSHTPNRGDNGEAIWRAFPTAMHLPWLAF